VPRPAHAARIAWGGRVALALGLVLAWVAGSTLGVATPASKPRAAQAMPLFQIQPAHAGYTPALDGSEPVFILVLGSDARPGETITGERADSIHIVALNPAKGRATIVGFPRDSWVPIPGYGTNKINSAMTEGGPELVVKTVEDLTGLKMNYWALTWFDGFISMINDIGGLTMDVPFGVHDTYAHAELDAGKQVLSGRDALAFARARHALPSGDLGRSENQGRLMIAALAQFQKEFHKDPASIFTWVGAGMRNSRTDIALDQLMTLAFTGANLNSHQVTNIVVPGGLAMEGTESVVTLDMDALGAISKDLEKDGIIGKKNIPPSPNADLLASGDTSSTSG
jgi:polyisoprenyl-teichoic acid--peptidoglycan teichoic acid transferase